MGKTSFQDITGNKYGNLTVLRLFRRNKGRLKWLCQCDCGNEIIVIGNNLKNGHTQSCGCYMKKRITETHTKHGDRKTRLYGIWTGIKSRCFNKNCSSYKNYGGRGISVCKEWLGSDGYIYFKEWALDNGYSDDYSIDRINVDKDYSPDNCRWVDNSTQANNTRQNRYLTINGETKTLAEWSRITGVKSGTIRYRIENGGMSPKEAINAKIKPNNRAEVEYQGKTYSYTELAKMVGITREAIKYRIKKGIPLTEGRLK